MPYARGCWILAAGNWETTLGWTTISPIPHKQVGRRCRALAVPLTLLAHFFFREKNAKLWLKPIAHTVVSLSRGLICMCLTKALLLLWFHREVTFYLLFAILAGWLNNLPLLSRTMFHPKLPWNVNSALQRQPSCFGSVLSNHSPPVVAFLMHEWSVGAMGIGLH